MREKTQADQLNHSRMGFLHSPLQPIPNTNFSYCSTTSLHSGYFAARSPCKADLVHTILIIRCRRRNHRCRRIRRPGGGKCPGIFRNEGGYLHTRIDCVSGARRARATLLVLTSNVHPLRWGFTAAMTPGLRRLRRCPPSTKNG